MKNCIKSVVVYYIFTICGTYGWQTSDCKQHSEIVLTCIGPETFPSVPKKVRDDIVYIDIKDSLLTKLPLFDNETWPRLEYLTFRNNLNLPCEEIYKQYDDHIFYIDHDCTRVKTPRNSSQQARCNIITTILFIAIAVHI